MRVIHRILLILSTIAFYSSLLMLLNGIDTKHFEISIWWKLAAPGILYYIVLIPYCLFDLIFKTKNNRLLWIVTILLLPILGVLVYTEMTIFKRRIIEKTEPEQSVDPEPIDESVKTKLLRTRAIAGLFDYTLYGVLSIIWFLLNAERSQGVFVLHGTGNNFILYSIWFIYFPVTEYVFGKTVFKHFFSIKVVDLNRMKIRLRQTTIRHLFDIIDIVFMGLSTVAFHKHGIHRLGDYFAKTQVVVDVKQR